MPARLGGDAIVRIWERGRREHPIDRALTVLGEFCGASRGELAELDLVRRDALLFACRAQIFDAPPTGAALCPQCGGDIEIAFSDAHHEAGEDGDGAVDIAGVRVEFRTPNSLDLAAIAACGSVDEARGMLAQRCVASDGAGDDVVAAVERELARRAGASSSALDITCPECGNGWSLAFDIGAFLWDELAALARRLLLDVDVLARRYGWTEGEILSLSPARRRFYLEVAS